MISGKGMIGPVFPDSDFGRNNGLTKRELFAAMAMQGMLSNPEYALESCEEIAGAAVRDADALISVLKEEEIGGGK